MVSEVSFLVLTLMPLQEEADLVVFAVGTGCRAQEVALVPCQHRCSSFLAVCLFFDLADVEVTHEQVAFLTHVLRGHVAVTTFPVAKRC